MLALGPCTKEKYMVVSSEDGANAMEYGLVFTGGEFFQKPPA